MPFFTNLVTNFQRSFFFSNVAQTIKMHISWFQNRGSSGKLQGTNNYPIIFLLGN